MNWQFFLAVPAVFVFSQTLPAETISGLVTDAATSVPVAGARVTLFSADLRFFREVRSAGDGRYNFTLVPDGSYQLGVAALRRAYVEQAVTVAAAALTRNLLLTPETHPGQWAIVGSTTPELLEGTGSASVLPTGEVIFCHDTIDPVIFEPLTATRWYPPTSTTPQGCHIPTVFTSGDAYYAGGSLSGNPQTGVVQVSEYYRRHTNSWTRLADMKEGRWYPGLVRLPDERMLIIGGEAQAEGYGRTNTCEIYDPVANTYTFTGSFARPQEIPPALLLRDGRVFKTWRDVEFYNIGTGTWSAGPPMLQERVGRNAGDHSDHEIIYLPDGRVMAVGIFPEATNTSPKMVEMFNVTGNSWSYGPNPRHLRRRPEVCLLPDGRVFCYGGEYTGPGAGSPVLKNAGQVGNCTNVTDLFDPETNSWRAAADANRWVHYHNVTVLLPDGRVLCTGGAGAGAVFGNDASIEAYSPPYLFRGVRPQIDSVSIESLTPGSTFTVNISRTLTPTRLVAVGARSATHWVDGGPQRYLSLSFTQAGGTLTATVPSDPAVALSGWYLLYVMVDDIPSAARMVRLTPSAAPALTRPTVSIAALNGVTSENGAPGSVRITRAGGAMAVPLAVSYALSGSAVSGADFGALNGFALLPAGQTSVTLTLTPVNDTLSEGSEQAVVTIVPQAAYNINAAAASATVTINDDDPVPPGSGLILQLPPTGGRLQISLRAAATARFILEASDDLFSWQSWTSLTTDGLGQAALSETLAPPYARRLFFRAEPSP